MRFTMLEKALLPFEKTLRAQERLRRLLGVREVDRPTYERYITGPVERFDRRRIAFATLHPDNSFGEEFRARFKARTGHDHFWGPLPQSELGDESRIGVSLTLAANRLCVEYRPQTLPITPPEGRLEVTDQAWLSRLIKKVALFFGAALVRITEVDPRWVFRGVEISHRYAIVVAVPHQRSMNNTAPSFFANVAPADTYSRLRFITTQLTDFICGLGYDAADRETRGAAPRAAPELQMVPLAMDAGIGEFARNGRVLSPEFGINMRLKAVTTDLPLKVDKPVSFGVHDFCMACEHCATYCPANAIPFGPPTDEPPTIHNNPGCRKWYIRADRCLIFWAANKKKWLGCGRCIAVCPWNKPINAFHNTVRWTAIHSPEAVKKILVWGDKIFYRHKKSLKSR